MPRHPKCIWKDFSADERKEIEETGLQRVSKPRFHPFPRPDTQGAGEVPHGQDLHDHYEGAAGKSGHKDGRTSTFRGNVLRRVLP